VTGFIFEVDDNFQIQSVPIGNAADAPTLVAAKGAGIQRFQFIGGSRFDFSPRKEFF
jgi:hypothetical protein